MWGKANERDQVHWFTVGSWYVAKQKAWVTACNLVTHTKPIPSENGDALCSVCAKAHTPKRGGTPRIRANKCYDEIYGDPLPFPSEMERAYFYELKIREKAGEVRDIRRQVVYKIMWNNVLIYTYTTDYVYERPRAFTNDWVTSVVDVKGRKDAKDSWPIVKKLMLAAFSIVVEEWP